MPQKSWNKNIKVIVNTLRVTRSIYDKPGLMLFMRSLLMPLTLSSHSAHSVRVINKNIRTEIFMRSCEKICELILTPRPARLTSEQAWVNKTQAVRAVMLPAMAFCGLKLSKLFSKQAHVILKQYLNKLENNEDEKQGENIGSVRMNEKLRKRNSSLWLELASLETERNWRCSWLEAGVLISVTSDSWGEWDNHRWHSHSTRAQNTSQQNGSREKTEQGNSWARPEHNFHSQIKTVCYSLLAGL